jgi:hypothetical protein
MALMTWKIELRVDFSEKSKDAIMEKDVRSKAKALITTAMLLAGDGRKPDIAIETTDMFVGATEISLFADGEEDA